MLAEDRRSVLESSGFSTQEIHLVAVERVIQTMRERLCDTLVLEDMADIACLSPYYFSRVFRNIVGLPPGEFLAMLRLDRAKHLLLTTSLSVTDICFEVGYVGLGSFTTRFTQLVGVSPRQLRTVVRHVATPSFIVSDEMRREASSEALSVGISGHIKTINPFNGLIFAGLFPKPIPQGQPIRCTLLKAAGPYAIHDVPAGRYFLLVAALPSSENIHTYLLPRNDVLVGIAGPIVVRHGITQEGVDVILRAPCLTDPPIISAVPFI